MAQDTMAMLCSTLHSTTGAFASEITGGGRREGPEDTRLSKLSHSKCRFLLKWPGKSESTLPEHSENAHRKPWGCCYWERRRKRVMEGSLPPLHQKRFVVPCSTQETVQMDKGNGRQLGCHKRDKTGSCVLWWSHRSGHLLSGDSKRGIYWPGLPTPYPYNVLMDLPVKMYIVYGNWRKCPLHYQHRQIWRKG